MKRYLIFILLLLIPLGYAISQTTDVMDNYTAGTGAGATLETDATGFRAANNTYVGTYAGNADSTGRGNTGIGSGALRGITTGFGNTGLGMEAGRGLTTESYKLYIETGWYPGTGFYGDFSTGFFGINNTSPNVALDITGALAVSGVTAFLDTLFLRPSAYSNYADSTWFVTLDTNGNPFLGFFGADADAMNIGVSVSDQLLFQNAGGGYSFDNELISIGTIDVKMSSYSDTADSTLIFSVPLGVPTITGFSPNTSTSTITWNDSDQIVFTGASGGISIPDSLILGRISFPSGTNDSGIVFRNLGTSNYGIDGRNSGLSGAADFFVSMNATNYWRADGKFLIPTVNVITKLTASNITTYLSGQNIRLETDSANSVLIGDNTAVGSITDATSNGTATIVKTTHGLSLSAGMRAHITDTAQVSDEGFYRVVSDDGSNIVIDRALAGSLSDVDITFYKDVIGIFATDGVNGQLIVGSSAQDKPIQLGGDVMEATGHSLGAEDILIGGSAGFEVNPKIFADGDIDIGTADTDDGLLTIYGDAANASGRIQFQPGADFDATENYWEMAPLATSDGDFIMGPASDTNAFLYTNDGNFSAVGGVQINTVDLLIPNFAGILVDGGGSITITTVNIFEQMTTFDTDMPEVVSNGAHGTDNITIGASGDYDAYFEANALSAGNNKEYDFNVFEITAATTAVAFVTAANPCVISSEGHGYVNGNRVKIEGVGGATGVNDRIYTVASETDSTYALDADQGTDVDGTGFGVWSSDGTAQLATKLEGVHRHRKFGTNSDQGAFGARSFETLTLNNTLELWILGISDATNITVEAATFGIKRIQ